MSREIRAHYARLAQDYGRKANRACEHSYRLVIRQWLSHAGSVLELGCGSACAISELDAPRCVAGDLTPEMLHAASVPPRIMRVACDSETLPFADGSYDAVFNVNLLEHVPHPERVFAEMTRVLTPGGRCVVITPNGDLAAVLAILERLHLKLPEGPHQFLTRQTLLDLATRHFTLIEHRRFLAFAAGPSWLVKGIDALVPACGLFQYAILKK